MKKERILELLSNFIGYCDELKERESAEDRELFFCENMGMTKEELDYFGISIESEV